MKIISAKMRAALVAADAATTCGRTPAGRGTLDRKRAEATEGSRGRGIGRAGTMTDKKAVITAVLAGTAVLLLIWK